jgi:hypothetical protein
MNLLMARKTKTGARLPPDLVDKINEIAELFREKTKADKANYSAALVYVLRDAEEAGLLDLNRIRKKLRDC